MTHQRKTIRDAIKTALLNDSGVTALTGTRIYTNRNEPTSVLPVIIIASGGEESRPYQANDGEERTYRVQIICRVSAETGVDDAMDALCEQVERVMKAHPYLDGACERHEQEGTEFDEDGESEADIGDAVIFYAITYLV